MKWLLGLTLCVAICLESGGITFAGVRALLIKPEIFTGWFPRGAEVSLYGVLESKGVDVTWGEPDLLEDEEALGEYDLVATSMRKVLSTEQIAGLQAYVQGGGSFYASWRGLLDCPEMLEFCGIEDTQRVDATISEELTILEGVLSTGLAETTWALPEWLGNDQLDSVFRDMIMYNLYTPDSGTVVAQDGAGNNVGIIHSQGQGRTAVLGFHLENLKNHFQSVDDANIVMDNLLAWLIPGEPKNPWSGKITVNLPVRAEVRSVKVGSALISNPEVQTRGSFKQVTVDVSGVAVGDTTTVRIKYAPLSAERNVETIVSVRPYLIEDFETPTEAVDYVVAFNPTIVGWPVRSAGGRVEYDGLPDETLSDGAAAYPGDFFTEFVDGCHNQGIKVYPYFSVGYPVALLAANLQYARVEKDGTTSETRACINRPEVQSHNFLSIEHLLDNYPMDNLVLNDSFEMDKNTCYCDYCKQQFQTWCGENGVTYEDPATTTDSVVWEAWITHKQEATTELAQSIRNITAAHNLLLGGWVSVGLEAIHLATTLDFLCGMTYKQPGLSARGMHSVLGDTPYVNLLWGPNRDPSAIKAEVAEAIHAGSSVTGVFVRSDEGIPSPKGIYMYSGSFAAITEALADAEEEWRRFYRNNIIAGDARFVVTGAILGAEDLTLVVKNTGSKVERRLEFPLDFSVVTYP